MEVILALDELVIDSIKVNYHLFCLSSVDLSLPWEESKMLPKTLDSWLMEWLTRSIRDEGLKSPLKVKLIDGKYHLIDGRHRYATLTFLNIKQARCDLIE